jgi:hypothetical protein
VLVRFDPARLHLFTHDGRTALSAAGDPDLLRVSLPA